MSETPNVLIIVIDQFRGDLLGGGGLARIAHLPRLREFASEAVMFANHYSVVSPCGPSRVSLLTGQYAMNHRAVRNGTPLRHDTPNMATAARTIGYSPQLFGYTDTTQDPRVLDAHDPRLRSAEELMAGFDEVLRMRSETDDRAWRDHLAAKGNPLPEYPATYRPDGDRVSDPARYAAEDSDTAFLTDRFIASMNGAAQGWFALLTYIRPHPPFVAPAPFNRMYDPADMPAPAAALRGEGDPDRHPFVAPARERQPPASMVVGFPDLDASAETTAELRAIYLGLASEVDMHFGRVVDWLKASGQWNDTVLVVTSDHGEMLGDYGLWGKGTFHEAAFRVPLIVRDPSRPDTHGEIVNDMTESIDVAVTLLDRLGAGVPHAMNGTSLLPFLDDVRGATRTCSMSEYDFGDPVTPTLWMRRLGVRSRESNLAVFRSGRYRLVQFGCDLPPILFDMDRDGEGRNIAGDPGAPELLQRVMGELLRHRMSNAEGTFAMTKVGDAGVRTGNC
ncbi:MAG: sulfatase-like hydrolase/transferase [Boseongicola sp.]|nr:sulfatase-like hydrolase/transferase [Boseongicola sp.]